MFSAFLSIKSTIITSVAMPTNIRLSISQNVMVFTPVAWASSTEGATSLLSEVQDQTAQMRKSIIRHVKGFVKEVINTIRGLSTHAEGAFLIPTMKGALA